MSDWDKDGQVDRDNDKYRPEEAIKRVVDRVSHERTYSNGYIHSDVDDGVDAIYILGKPF